MVNVHSLDSSLLCHFINHFRTFFLNAGFAEITLFDTTPYFIKDWGQIATNTGEYLRSTTEPEVWHMGLDHAYDKFFCITSLFRRESTKSWLHKNEFKLVDFYIRNSNEDALLTLYYDCLSYLETTLDLPHFSTLATSSFSFDEASTLPFAHYNDRILRVDHYPLNDSFYDEFDPSTGTVKRGELFYVNDGQPLEFGAYGQLGNNANPNRSIPFVPPIDDLGSLNIYWGCIGIERLMICYELLRHFRG